MSVGTVFINGVDGPLSHQFNWAERLTVVRDASGYSERYVVADKYGRHGYVYQGLRED
ncbi:hypothetical protein FDI14_gp112 [Mycobacterium phage SirDuracell]|uniref:Uncharacterized protein n=10 Tax=Viruses TaxID=10239 RepID=A0A1L7DS25_9CAUD|nr:hypothetical protein PBI_MURPHY_139 [Mycobacterium phage Murphy]YP_008052313.1 hypothetical protein M039_gp115 [Mycobacterium phage Phaux]YP_008409533.1 hypothetical protein DRDREY_142 [Mycobacterium phage DrDrey]YP_008857628.1 hypothetical protein PHATBACTER_143 [Mycobacterium phage PhatBacter]YP_008859571.1 hypothetical protein BRUIN_136 [Mycobacterium phage Bruin]YP_009224406.1 hypothetical protein SEA_DUSK_140 [Mycobacterium phage Dusk]YP_009608070.1 hypothetical protein FDI14_gp112 [M